MTYRKEERASLLDAGQWSWTTRNAEAPDQRRINLNRSARDKGNTRSAASQC
ncbi:hypothetical protein WAK64_18225 [Bacillus spongiae]|uniref:YpzG family protein n=1 Tax=Bacillus spongiae TaxID=2683610 RepID=A0ABU8HIS3_9BACI